MECEVGEGFQFEEVTAIRGLVDDLVLQHPREAVRDEDGVQAGAERGVDVRLGAIADHPGPLKIALVLVSEFAIRSVGLFGQHFDGLEMRSQSGA